MHRRAFLSIAAASAAMAETNVGQVFQSEFRKYGDPATELEVIRLTNPENSTLLPAPSQRAVSRKSAFLLCSSERSGSLQAMRIDLKSGQLRQLTQVAALDPRSPTLLPDERGFCFFDGPSLRQAGFSLREREVYRIPDAFTRTAGFNLGDDGVNAVFFERQQNNSRLRVVHMAKGDAATVLELKAEASDPVIRPKRTQILYRQADGSLWLVNMDGKQNRQLKTEPGITGPARWAPGGRTILYLHFPQDTSQLVTLREHTPDENADKLVAKTSQFSGFGSNGDGSVFVGASRSKASPNILILLRSVKRELTLCEHKATDPAQVEPIFSPNSQDIFFQSDRHGKPAIYRVKVERFVEETDEG